MPSKSIDVSKRLKPLKQDRGRHFQIAYLGGSKDLFTTI